MGERPTLCHWCRADDPEGCERMGTTCTAELERWEMRRELYALRKLADAVEDMRPLLEAERSIHPALDSGRDADAVLRALNEVRDG